MEYALFRTDVLYQAILRFCDVLPQGDFILDCVREVRECLLECTCVSENEGGHVLHSDYRAVAERQFTVRRGRPRYEVTKEQLEFFVERRFSVSEMASLLNVSPRTVERRLNEFGLSLRNNYSDIYIYIYILKDTGNKKLQSHLKERLKLCLMSCPPSCITS